MWVHIYYIYLYISSSLSRCHVLWWLGLVGYTPSRRPSLTNGPPIRAFGQLMIWFGYSLRRSWWKLWTNVHLSVSRPLLEDLLRRWGLLAAGRLRSGAENKANIPQRLAEQEHSWQEEVGGWHPPTEQIPRVFFPGEVFYLVLFSGHRRFDDIATQIWKLDFGPRLVWPLCLDLCLDQKQGNLLDLEVQAFWNSQIHQGRVIGCHSSPPCETYTEARHIPLPDGQTRPRPLRGWTFPWGLPSLDLKEIKQVTTGNVLFYITAIFVAWVLTHGGCATVEHPQGRKASEGRFTIWFSAFLRRLQQHHECFTFTFCQGYLGQVSLKPTTFLLVRLPCAASLGSPQRTFSHAAGQEGWWSWIGDFSRKGISPSFVLGHCTVGPSFLSGPVLYRRAFIAHLARYSRPNVATLPPICDHNGPRFLGLGPRRISHPCMVPRQRIASSSWNKIFIHDTWTLEVCHWIVGSDLATHWCKREL